MPRKSQTLLSVYLRAAFENLLFFARQTVADGKHGVHCAAAEEKLKPKIYHDAQQSRLHKHIFAHNTMRVECCALC